MSRFTLDRSDKARLREKKSFPRSLRHILTALVAPSLIGGCAAPHKAEVVSVSPPINAKYVVFHVRPRFRVPDELPSPVEDIPLQYVPKSMMPPAAEDDSFGKLVTRRSKAPPAMAMTRLQEKLRKGKNLPAPAIGAAARPFSGKYPKLEAKEAVGEGIWERVRKNLRLTGVEHEAVQAEIERFRQSPGALEFLLKRAEPFLYYIVEEIERRGLPMDLIMTPMVESAFDPAALSPKQAAGIWQFIPGTATDYGLTMNESYDARYDLHAATKAALTHLARLNKIFGGDWLLSLAAYNAGEGAVQRAMQANQKAGLGTSFWELNLPSETKAYVPKILALARVAADPLTQGLKLRKIASAPYLARMEVNATMTPAQLAVVAGMSWEAFFGLNPAFKPDLPPPQPCNLLLPPDKAETLALNHPGAKIMGSRTYVVKKGDTLPAVAKRQGVPRLKLALWNGLKADSKLVPGQALVIYPLT
jgi:membrane-bound lytic murein transglycosylase D